MKNIALVGVLALAVASLAGCSTPFGSAAVTIGNAVAPTVEADLCKNLSKDKIVSKKTCKTVAGVIVSTATAAAQVEMAPATCS